MVDETKNEETTVVIEEPAEETAEDSIVTVADAKELGLSEEEIALGKEQGDIVDEKPEKKEEEVKKEPEKKEEVVKKPAEDKKSEEDDDIDPEKEMEKIKDFTANEKAQYFMRKKERAKRQKSDRKAELLEIKLNAAQKQLDLMAKNSGKKEDLDDLDAELDEELKDKKKEEDTEVVTKGDLKKRDQEQQKLVEKARAVKYSLTERYNDARVEDANFDELCDLANEVMKEDAEEGGMYATKLVLLAEDPEGDIAGFIKKLAKLHTGYAEVGKKKTEEKSEDGQKKVTSRIIENATKRPSSASVGGGSGRRIVSEADLTVEDAAKLTDEAYGKLKPETRERLLRESSR